MFVVVVVVEVVEAVVEGRRTVVVVGLLDLQPKQQLQRPVERGKKKDLPLRSSLFDLLVQGFVAVVVVVVMGDEIEVAIWSVVEALISPEIIGVEFRGYHLDGLLVVAVVVSVWVVIVVVVVVGSRRKKRLRVVLMVSIVLVAGVVVASTTRLPRTSCAIPKKILQLTQLNVKEGEKKYC